MIFIIGVFCLAFLLSSAQTLKKKSDYLFHIGASTHINLNFHTTNIKELPSVPNCCSQFNFGFGTGLRMGLEIGELLNDKLVLSGRIVFSDLYGMLKELEIKKIIIDNNLIDATIEHTIEAKYATFSLEPLFRYRFVPEFDAILGISVGYLFKHNYYQQEKLIYPEHRGTFENMKRIRNDLSGKINDVNFFIISLVYGLSIDFKPLENKSIILSPELLIYQNLNSLLKYRNWFILNFSFGVTARFIFREETPSEQLSL